MKSHTKHVLLDGKIMHLILFDYELFNNIRDKNKYLKIKKKRYRK